MPARPQKGFSERSSERCVHVRFAVRFHFDPSGCSRCVGLSGGQRKTRGEGCGCQIAMRSDVRGGCVGDLGNGMSGCIWPAPLCHWRALVCTSFATVCAEGQRNAPQRAAATCADKMQQGGCCRRCRHIAPDSCCDMCRHTDQMVAAAGADRLHQTIVVAGSDSMRQTIAATGADNMHQTTAAAGADTLHQTTAAAGGRQTAPNNCRRCRQHALAPRGK